MSDHEHKSEGHGDGEHKKSHKKHHHAAHPEHEHEEGWIVSFADNVLLMMAFFVILLAMNMGEKGTSDSPPSETAQDRLLDVAIAVREAFNNPLSLSSTAPEDQPLIRRMKSRRSKGSSKTGAPDGEANSVQNVRPDDWAGEGAMVRFGDKEATLDTEAQRTVAQLAERVLGAQWVIEVRGHASRWESWGDQKKAHDLAFQRAWAVGAELVAHGLSWNQIRLSSSGDALPVLARSDTAEQSQTNQRVEIIVLDQTAPANPYGEGAEPASGP